MVNFTRSPSGIRNSALFFGVDRIVYVEGTGADQNFWKNVFDVFYSGPLRFHFKSLGSRSAVLPYADGIAKGSITNIVAIVDSDYEGLRFSRFNIPNLIYSYGYSFENDLLTPKQAIKLISQLSGDAGIRKYKNLLQRLGKAATELSALSVLDFVAQFNDQYLLEKNGKTCKLHIKNNSMEVICSNSIKAAKKSLITRGVKINGRPTKLIRDQITKNPKHRWIYGHLWQATFTKCVSDELRKKWSVTINPDGLVHLAINNVLASNGKVFTHQQISEYKKQISYIR